MWDGNHWICPRYSIYLFFHENNKTPVLRQCNDLSQLTCQLMTPIDVNQGTVKPTLWLSWLGQGLGEQATSPSDPICMSTDKDYNANIYIIFTTCWSQFWSNPHPSSPATNPGFRRWHMQQNLTSQERLWCLSQAKRVLASVPMTVVEYLQALKFFWRFGKAVEVCLKTDKRRSNIEAYTKSIHPTPKVRK